MKADPLGGAPKIQRLEVVEGDITKQNVDAIVNAANTSLRGGGGVDGAIHRAAGPALLEECRSLGGCPTGEARITRGYNLPARWVIHTVGPVWSGVSERVDELLAQCYRSCFALVVEHGIRTVAFPSISTGAYGFPIERASRIALREIGDFLNGDNVGSRGTDPSLRSRMTVGGDPSVEMVSVVCFSARDRQVYLKALEELSAL